MSKGKKRGRQSVKQFKPDDPKATAPDWTKKCENCGATPIVPVTGLCGPCTFGEAATIGGKLVNPLLEKACYSEGLLRGMAMRDTFDAEIKGNLLNAAGVIKAMRTELFDALLVEIHSMRSTLASRGIHPPRVLPELEDMYYATYREPLTREVK